MSHKQFLLILVCLIGALNALPPVYYASLGDTVTLQCSGGGSFACFSTYTLQKTSTPMVMLNSSAKYQISMGSITIQGVQATDAGFYACSSNCYQMNTNQINYFLQPMSNGQPVDTSRFWVPIPPLPNNNDAINANKYFVVVSDERLDAAAANAGLNAGEIAALVIGILIAFVITISILVFLFILHRRRQKKHGEKKLIEPGLRKEKKENPEYSTMEREYDQSEITLPPNQSNDRDGERRSLSSNKANNNQQQQLQQPDNISNLSNIVGEINTKFMKGPSTYKPSDSTLIHPQDLPSIDIGFNKTSSQRSQNPLSNNYSNRSYVNQLDQPYQQQQQSIIEQPPSKGRVQFPARLNRPQQPQPTQQQAQQPSQRYVASDNINLKNIPTNEEALKPFYDDFTDQDDLYRKSNFQNGGGYYTGNNNRMRYFENDDNSDEFYPYRSNQYDNPDLDNEGGVTVVSARTPTRHNSVDSGQPPQQHQAAYQIRNPNQPPPPPPPPPQQQNQKFSSNGNKQTLPPHLSFSQRVETTSTPLHVPPSSASVRNALPNSNFAMKDGSTDV